MEDPAYRVEADRRRGRGSPANPTGRFEPVRRETFEDGWAFEEEIAPLPTEVIIEKPRTIIAQQRFARYRLRPLDQSLPGLRARLRPIASRGRATRSRACPPGLDFETKIFAKPSAPELLEKELRAKGYEPRTIAHGVEHRSLSAGRAELPHHAPDPRGARTGRTTRSAS